MKSVLQAGWLMAVAVGNVIVIIISGAQLIEDQVSYYPTRSAMIHFPGHWLRFLSICLQASEFFLFAGLIGVFAIVFAIMARYYVYVDSSESIKGEKEVKTEDAESDSL
jgi:solute carrier family 15 (oligopeptide transporter), member 1